jgi:hypothetical protein
MNLVEGMQLGLSVPFTARGTKVPPVAPDRRSGSLHLAGGVRIQIPIVPLLFKYPFNNGHESYWDGNYSMDPEMVWQCPRFAHIRWAGRKVKKKIASKILKF